MQWRRVSFIGMAMVLVCGLTVPQASSEENGWTAAWGTAMQTSSFLPAADFTCRNEMRMSLSGEVLRIHLSTRFATSPVEFAAVSVGKQAKGASVVEGSLRDVTFSGKKSVTIPANSEIVSDPISLSIDAGETISVSMHVPDWGVEMTQHSSAPVSQYCTSSWAGDRTNSTSADGFNVHGTAVLWTSEVDIQSSENKGSIVAFGDSITEGYGSSLDAHSTWPDLLSNRLVAQGQEVGVVNAGIGANAASVSVAGQQRGVDRFDADVIERSGVKSVILLIGSNDIAVGVPASEVIDAISSLAQRARQAGIRVVGGTLIPRRGGWGGFDDIKDDYRKTVNEYIRTSDDFDAVIDFDKAVRNDDQYYPFSHFANAAYDQLLDPDFNVGDFAHPNDAGYRAMANSIVLEDLLP